jgi:hypothetical protein
VFGGRDRFVVVSRGGRGCDEWVELRVEKVDEGDFLEGSWEDSEARVVVRELGADLGFVKSRRWQQRELPSCGDVAGCEDRGGVGVGVRDAIV